MARQGKDRRGNPAFSALLAPDSVEAPRCCVALRPLGRMPDPATLRLHYLLEGGLEFGHFFLRAYRDADVGWHDGPDAPDHHVLFCHRVADFLARPLRVEQEAV